MRHQAREAERESRRHVLILDDDPVNRSMMATFLAAEGFLVREAGTARECRMALKAAMPDLLLVDIRLPDANGIAFAQEVRASSPVGIIFVTQQDNEIDHILGLESAGDDYITKPINLRILVARARALLRRRALDRQAPSRAGVVTFGPFVMDLTRRELATTAGALVGLTRGEFDLLAALVEAEGRALYRDYLAEVIGSRLGESNGRTVDSLIARLRRKLGAVDGGGGLILTVTSVGYRFAGSASRA